MNELRFKAPALARALMFAACALMVSAGALAQAPNPETRVITFRDAVRIALEQNTQLRIARNSTALDAVDVAAARSQFLPDLQLNTRGAQNYGRMFSETEGRIINQSTRSFNVGVNSSVALFNGFGDLAALRRAQFNEKAGEHDLKRAQQTVFFTVATNFLALVQQQEQLRVQRENLSAASVLEQQIQSFVDAGARTIADLYQQQANLANARFAVLEAERAVELAKVDLMQTLQLDPAGTYEFEAPPADTVTAAKEQLSLPELLDRATANRADLEAELARLEAAQQAIRVARANRWPTISLNTSYSSAYTSVSEQSFSDQLDDRRGGSIGLGFSIPLFDRGTTAIATRRAEIQADNAQLSLESLQNEIGLQVRRAYQDLRAAQAQLGVAEAQLRAAELALQAAQDRYSAGASTLVELTQARATQVRAASALVSARYNLLFQRTLVDYYVGNIDLARYGID
jgi:outer membrane protein